MNEKYKDWSAQARLVAMRFEQGLWNIFMVKNAVRKGVLTKEQFKELTGEDYK